MSAVKRRPHVERMDGQTEHRAEQERGKGERKKKKKKRKHREAQARSSMSRGCGKTTSVRGGGADGTSRNLYRKLGDSRFESNTS